MTIDFSRQIMQIILFFFPYQRRRISIFKKLIPKTCLTIAATPAMLLSSTRNSVCFIVFSSCCFLFLFISFSIILKLHHYCHFLLPTLEIFDGICLKCMKRIFKKGKKKKNQKTKGNFKFPKYFNIHSCFYFSTTLSKDLSIKLTVIS